MSPVLYCPQANATPHIGTSTLGLTSPPRGQCSVGSHLWHMLPQMAQGVPQGLRTTVAAGLAEPASPHPDVVLKRCCQGNTRRDAWRSSLGSTLRGHLRQRDSQRPSPSSPPMNHRGICPATPFSDVGNFQGTHACPGGHTWGRSKCPTGNISPSGRECFE